MLPSMALLYVLCCRASCSVFFTFYVFIITFYLMTVADLLPTFIRIPTTPFPMGTPERDLSVLAKAYGGTRESYREESPQHTLALPAFALAQTPTTNGLYAAYVAASGARAPIIWRGAQPPDALRDHPVVDV